MLMTSLVNEETYNPPPCEISSSGLDTELFEKVAAVRVAETSLKYIPPPLPAQFSGPTQAAEKTVLLVNSTFLTITGAFVEKEDR